MNRLLHHTVKEIEHFFVILADNNTPERRKTQREDNEEENIQTHSPYKDETHKDETLENSQTKH